MAHLLDRPTANAADSDSEMVAKNIDGVFDFLRAIAADPSLADDVPPGAAFYSDHADAPHITAKNRAAAKRTQLRGVPVYVHRVRVKNATAPRRPAATRLKLRGMLHIRTAPARLAARARGKFGRVID